ncbi:MAG: double-strand break repair protein AddB [Rhodobiaceae bacterium]|nr:double-strand break repair protein AddB [Rhodobiaceae bacterium]MCC0055266.1 double-strand break repair protein AddB [Rhodobiaceae bacterium]
MKVTPKVWTIPPSVPFLPALAEALHSGLLPGFGPDAAQRATILLPTRRAAIGLTELLARRAPGGAAILPSIRTLGDIDADRMVTDGDETGATDIQGLAGRAAIDFLRRPVIAPMARHLELTWLVLEWGRRVAGNLRLPNGDSPAAPTQAREAASLAGQLAGLMDSLEIEEVDPARIAELTGDGFESYWDVTLKFLSIMTQEWPKILAARGALDAAARRSRLIEAFRQRLEKEQGDAPVIAAGSTGSVPATARLLRTISRLPNGHVILPGLDTHLDAPSFDAITNSDSLHPGHPQFGLARLLQAIGTSRDQIEVLDPETVENGHRDMLFSSLMRPAATAELWAGDDRWRGGKDVDEALGGVTLLEARDDREEALSIAVAMREALEQRGKRAALVTPDRILARRVKAELGRWNIDVADSAGVPLAETDAGRLARLIAEAVASRLPPETVIALLHHPLSRLGYERESLQTAAQALEIMTLRGPRPGPASGGLVAALMARLDALADPATRADPIIRRAHLLGEEARELASRLQGALSPLEALESGDLRTLALAHRDAMLAVVQDEAGMMPPDAAPVVAMLDEIAGSAPDSLTIAITDYPGLFDALIAGRNMPDYGRSHPRLQILGTIEARLVDTDLMILGGLNEGVWPGEAVVDPFLDRTSRKAVGLPAPERRIGLAAHDFVQAAAGREVILSRAAASGGKPAIPSRWLQRLRTVIGQDRYGELGRRGARLGAIARALDQRSPVISFPEPKPRPPVEKRPRRISASRITTWIRDPYTIYASAILKLDPLEAVGAAPGPAERGTFIHAALEIFERERMEGIGGDKLGHLIACGERALAPLAIYPDLTALWRRQFVRIATWYLAWRETRVPHITSSLIEKHGRLPLDMPGGPYLLTAIADRIDIMKDGTIEILDYKTGVPPSAAVVRSGLEPQLTIEAAMVAAGTWDKHHEGRAIGALRYLKLGGGHPPGEELEITPERGSTFDPNEAAAEALSGLRSLIEAYDRQEQPYLVKPRVAFLLRYADYDHLSRHAEWSAMEDAEGEA